MKKISLLLIASVISVPVWGESVEKRLNVLERRADSAGRLVLQIQQLQQQVQHLQGELEAQAHEIQQLKRQQQDLYRDLDQRISSSTQSQVHLVANNEDAGSKALDSAPVVIAPESTANPIDEEADYQSAFSLLKAREFNAAAKAFETFIKRYPQGKYLENAYYWLGESYYIQQHYKDSAKAFESLVKQFPEGSKSSGAMLKLGFIYQKQGNMSKAKQYLNAVVKRYPGSNTARLAKSRLAQM